MKFQISSTGGHAPTTEDYTGTLDEFIRFKFGSFHAMRDTGCDVSIVEETVVTTTPVVESKSIAKRKKAQQDAE